MEAYMGNWSQSTLKNGKTQNSHKAEIEQIFTKYKYKTQLASSFNQHSTIDHIRSILYHPCDPKNTQTIQSASQLSNKWLKPLTQLYSTEPELFSQPSLQCYQCWVLSARVLRSLEEFFDKISKSNSSFSGQKDEVNKLGNYLSKNALRFVFARQLFSKKKYDRSYYSSHYSEEQQLNLKDNWAQQVYEYCREEKCEMMVKVLQLLAAVDIARLDGDNNKPKINNSFMDSLQNIHRQQQKQMFVKNYTFVQLQALTQAKDNEHSLGVIRKTLPNYTFYKNMKQNTRHKQLDALHHKFEDYQFLEHTHDYIQWLFPNHYGSSFNSDSFPLSYIESQLFLKDKLIQINLLYSIVMFFDFMGLRFNHEHKLVIEQKGRLKDVILKCHHNHLRIMRILACLSVTGFRDIALELIEFLDKHTRSGGILAKERREFEKNWQIYGQNKLVRAKEMCFLQSAEFPDSHGFWKQITSIIPIDKSKRSWTSTSYYQQYESDSQQEGIQQQASTHAQSKEAKAETNDRVEQPAEKTGLQLKSTSELQQQKMVSHQQQNTKTTGKQTEPIGNASAQQKQMKAESEETSLPNQPAVFRQSETGAPIQ